MTGQPPHTPSSHHLQPLPQGMGLALGSLAGDLRINFLLTALAELPAYLVIAAAAKRVGRKWVWRDPCCACCGAYLCVLYSWCVLSFATHG